MRVAIVPYGSRGDVQPLVHLGRALADRGHEVNVAAPLSGEAMVRAAGLPFRALPVDFQALLRTETARQMLAQGRINALSRWLGEQERSFEAELRAELLAATDGVDLIVCGNGAHPRCRSIGEGRGIPVMPVYLAPLHTSSTFASIFVTQRNLGPLNRLSHLVPYYVLWRSQREGLTALRRELGLSSSSWAHWRANLSDPALLAYSPALFSRPADWGDGLRVTGFMRPPRELRERLGDCGLPAELEDWLGAGPPPVFLGFGSMPVLDEQAMLPTVRAALARLGMRGVLAVGWSELTAAADDALYVIDEVDHEALLPRCAAAVHHGGAGTTAASVAAGAPTLVCSVFFDQPFWGARCRALGIGDTLPFTELDSDSLAAGLRRVLDPAVAARAREVGRRVAAEDGIAAAVACVESQGRGAPARAPATAG